MIPGLFATAYGKLATVATPMNGLRKTGIAPPNSDVFGHFRVVTCRNTSFVMKRTYLWDTPWSIGLTSYKMKLKIMSSGSREKLGKWIWTGKQLRSKMTRVNSFSLVSLIALALLCLAACNSLHCNNGRSTHISNKQKHRTICHRLAGGWKSRQCDIYELLVHLML